MKTDGSKGDITRSRIIGAAKRLFGTKTYDYVTTRMIAKEAHCSQSAISFYFETKENLCACVIQDILKYHKLYYEPIKRAVEECEKRGEMTQDAALGYLHQYISTQIEIAFDPHNRCAISFSVNGSVLPEGVADPLNESAMNNVLLPMARLISSYADLPLLRSLVFSKSLSDSILCFPFTEPRIIPMYIAVGAAPLKSAEGNLYDDQIMNREIRQYLMDYCMQTIRSLRSNN